MSSSVGVGGDDNREWTTWPCPSCAALPGQPCKGDTTPRIGGPHIQRIQLAEDWVPRSRLERVEAERDAMRDVLEQTYGLLGSFIDSEGQPRPVKPAVVARLREETWRALGVEA
jgi:hypothetical protein